MKFLKEHTKAITGVGIVLLLIAGYLIYSSTNKSGAADNQTVAVAKVTRGPIEVTVSGTGTITPLASASNDTDVSGIVQKLYVKNGDHVKKGDTLAELRNDDLSLELSKARLAVSKAQVNANQSADNLAADYITAPISGRITNFDAKNGDQVSNNSTLATIQNDSQLVFDMPVTSYVAGKAAINQKVEVFLPDQDKTVEGRVQSKNAQPVSGYNGESRAYLKVAIPATGNLNSGTTAFGTITIDGKKVDALSVAAMEWIGQVDVKSTLSGKITQLYVHEGMVVKKGDKIAYLSSTSNLSQQQSQQYSLDEARLSLSDVEKRYADLMVKAPVDGVITGLDAQVGDEINPQNENDSSNDTTANKTLGKVMATEQMEVTFPVDEVDITKVKLDQVSNITIDAIPDKVFTGKVTEIAPEGKITNNVSSFDVTILVDNPEKVLKSGMTANVSIVTSEKESALLIPIEALQTDGQKKFVYIRDANQKRTLKEIKIGLSNDTFVEISSGDLREGDQLVIPNADNSSSRQNSSNRSMGAPGVGGMGMGGPR